MRPGDLMSVYKSWLPNLCVSVLFWSAQSDTSVEEGSYRTNDLLLPGLTLADDTFLTNAGVRKHSFTSEIISFKMWAANLFFSSWYFWPATPQMP